MIYDNVCMFVPSGDNLGDMHVLHFVKEVSPASFSRMRTMAFYRLHIITEGECVFRTQYGEYSLKKGDIFLVFPALPYALETSKEFQYLYADFLGTQIDLIADKLKISTRNCIFLGYSELLSSWENALKMPKEVAHLSAKSIIYQTFAAIGARVTLPSTKANTAAYQIKKYVDENFSSPDLSLQSLCAEFSYSTKYISALFKSEFKISFKSYLNQIRIHNACALMEKGFSGVKTVAFLCGFSDPLYFSKLFKAQTGVSPTDFINTAQQRGFNC